MRTINASSSAMQPASEQDDIVNSPNYEDIAVVELQLCTERSPHNFPKA